MVFEIDGSLYPDVDPPEALDSLGDRVDFLARLCGAWDFGLLPDRATVTEIKAHDWTEAVAACNLLTSPAYHLLLRWHGLPERPYLGQRPSWIVDDPSLAFV